MELMLNALTSDSLSQVTTKENRLDFTLSCGYSIPSVKPPHKQPHLCQPASTAFAARRCVHCYRVSTCVFKYFFSLNGDPITILYKRMQHGKD